MSTFPQDLFPIIFFYSGMSILSFYMVMSLGRHQEFYRKVDEFQKNGDENGLLIYLLNYKTRDLYTRLKRNFLIKNIQDPEI